MNRLFAPLLALGLLLGGTAQAQVAPPKMDRGQREQMLKRIHTGFIVELGEILGLDTTGTIKLSERLDPYNKQRIQLQMDNWDAIQNLKQISGGTASGNPADLARRIAKNRIQLAQNDQAELEEIIKGQPPEKVAKAAVFITEFPKRLERMAREIIRDKMMKGGPGGQPGDKPQEE